jgi:quaternary ammonium compound-resistance protein SugE
MAWVFLLVAGLLEIVWAVGLKYTEGFTRLWPSVITLIAMILSMGSLGLSLKELSMGTAYLIWTGIGGVGTAILGIYLFNESAQPLRLFFMCLIILGLVGLKFTNA